MMKNTIRFAAVLAAGIICLSADAKTDKSYYTNSVELAQKAIANGRWWFDIGRINPTELDSIDEMVASANTNVNIGVASGLRGDGVVQRMPKSAKKWFENVWVKKSPAYATKQYMSEYFGKPYRDDPYYIANSIDIIGTDVPHFGWFKSYKQRVIHHALGTTKIKIRKEGKSFVVKDGYNPVQERLNALSKALDAPRMAGMKEACEACGIEFTTDIEKLLPSVEKVNSLMDDIFFGKIEFSSQKKELLLICLGVDGYNAFVKKYNGDAE